MRRVLVFQHVAVEPLGTLLPLLRSYRLRIRYVNFERHPDASPTAEGYDGLIVLGGPMSAWDDATCPHLTRELRAIDEALESDIPVLGICLGAQLLARCLGARVQPAERREIGWHDVEPTEAGCADPVLGAFAPIERLFQWHRDTFDLPRGAVHLARSAADGCAHQAFRYGERAYGLQFHLEADAALIERWLNTPEHRQELEASEETPSAEAIRAETRRRIARSLRLSDETFGRFVGRWTGRARRSEHPHR
jgi:GMP synthase (glutamine-hydrolysing)